MPIPRPSHEELQAVMHHEMPVYPPPGSGARMAEGASLLWLVGTLLAIIAAFVAVILLF